MKQPGNYEQQKLEKVSKCKSVRRNSIYSLNKPKIRRDLEESSERSSEYDDKIHFKKLVPKLLNKKRTRFEFEGNFVLKVIEF